MSLHVLKHSIVYLKGEMGCVLYLLSALLNQHNPSALEKRGSGTLAVVVLLVQLFAMKGLARKG